MSRSRQRGTSFETSLLPALRTVWPHAERRALQGAKDKGDFLLPSGLFAIEAKNCSQPKIPEWLREAKAEANNADVPVGVVIAKRRGTTDPMEQFVHMALDDFLWLAKYAEAGWAAR